MNLIGWDLETTNPDIHSARIVQLGAIRRFVNDSAWDHEVLADCLLNPGVKIDEGASKVHGITNDMVEGEQLDHEVAREFIAAVDELASKSPVILATHNGIQFDRPVLERVAGQPFRHPMIDTLIISRRLFPTFPEHRLTTLTQLLKLGAGEGAHEAIADVRMVLDLVSEFSKRTGKDLEELARWCETPFIMSFCYFGKHKGKHWEDVPKGYVDFITREFDDPSHDMIATIKHYFDLDFQKVKR